MERYSEMFSLGENLPETPAGTKGSLCGWNVFIYKKRGESAGKTLIGGRKQSLWWWSMVREISLGIELTGATPP
jgi:hypothetical protein